VLVTVRLMIGALFSTEYTATTELYTLSLHDALPISCGRTGKRWSVAAWAFTTISRHLPSSLMKRGFRWDRAESDEARTSVEGSRSEEHTSELQSPYDLVCRLLLEKKKYLMIQC